MIKKIRRYRVVADYTYRVPKSTTRSPLIVLVLIGFTNMLCENAFDAHMEFTEIWYVDAACKTATAFCSVYSVSI